MKKLFVVLFTLLLVLAGCSKQEPEEDVFVVGTECNSSPLNYQLAEPTDTSIQIEGGYADGYDMMIARDIANAIGKKLVVKKVSWEGLIPALQNGEIDAIIADMTATDEREQSVDFTTPYWQENGLVVVVKKGSDCEKFTDVSQFKGYTLVAHMNSVHDQAIDEIEGVIHGTPKLVVSELPMVVQNGDADGTVVSATEGEAIVAANSDLVMVTFAPGHGFSMENSVSVALPEGSRGSDLFNKVQAAIDNIDQATREKYMEDAKAKAPSEE